MADDPLHQHTVGYLWRKTLRGAGPSGIKLHNLPPTLRVAGFGAGLSASSSLLLGSGQVDTSRIGQEAANLRDCLSDPPDESLERDDRFHPRDT